MLAQDSSLSGNLNEPHFKAAVMVQPVISFYLHRLITTTCFMLLSQTLLYNSQYIEMLNAILSSSVLGGKKCTHILNSVETWQTPASKSMHTSTFQEKKKMLKAGKS